MLDLDPIPAVNPFFKGMVVAVALSIPMWVAIISFGRLVL